MRKKFYRLGDSSHYPGNDPEEYSPWDTSQTSMIIIDHHFIEPTYRIGRSGWKRPGERYSRLSSGI
ncbi:MAG TPA: hypothetical protein VII90_09570 [Anaerolineales bacterium]